MIEFISTWAKSLGVTIILVSIIEMLLPNNKTKKYIRVILGIFVLFNIISPFIKNKEQLNVIEEISSADLEKYSSEYDNYKGNSNNNSEDNNNLNQTSMDKRITELYKQELERSIKSKIEEIGYEVESCKVEAEIIDNETGIKKVKVKIGDKKEENNKDEENKDKNSENSNENNENENDENENNEKTTEEKIVEEIDKIKKVDRIDTINIFKSKEENTENEKNNIEEDKENNNKITKTDIQKIKNILKEEYGVSEDCLEIN